MISLDLASSEARPRDLRRKRFVLKVGDQIFKMTEEEVVGLQYDCENSLEESWRLAKKHDKKKRAALGRHGRKTVRALGRGLDALFKPPIPKKKGKR